MKKVVSREKEPNTCGFLQKSKVQKTAVHHLAPLSNPNLVDPNKKFNKILKLLVKTFREISQNILRWACKFLLLIMLVNLYPPKKK